MKIAKLTLSVMAALSFSFGGFAADPVKNDPAIFSKPAPGASETLSGQIGHASKGGDKGAKKSKKTESAELVLHVAEHHGKKKADAGAQHGKSVTLSATGDVLTQLNDLAKNHAHVKVTGTLSGETLTVTSVTEEQHKGKKK